MTTADKILFIMRHNGWTKDVCADEIGVHVTQLNRWLRGVIPSEKNMNTIDSLYIQLVFKPKRPKYIPRKREKIVIEYPYYSHQRQPWEK
ncbi:TPA: hypothetical protein U1375_000239 [Streptococcus suis]|nr:hypothetical protein [Streptococcus suis]HEM5303823.1 hypothetical protein [Streptococcus suis]